MRPLYDLTDAQAQRILEIEFAFHGTGNPFTRPAHTREEADAHHREIAATMHPAAPALFLRDQQHAGK